MNKKSIQVAAICVLMVLSLLTSAQTNRKDIVYLKNGSVIKGIITEMVPDSTIKIETADGSIFIYKTTEVERTAKEEIKKPEVKPVPVVYEAIKKEDQEETLTPSGYFIMAKLGPNIRPENDEVLYVSGGIINGYHLNKYLSLGLGVEATQYSFGNSYSNNQISRINVFPVFLDARLHLPKGRVNPMFSFQFGYSITGNAKISGTQGSFDFSPQSRKGGLYMALGAGVRVAINKTLAFVAEGGPSLQNLSGYNYSNSNGSFPPSSNNLTDNTVVSLRLNIGLAISFGK